MENKRVDLNAAAEEAGKKMKSLFGKAKETLVKAVDQNNDGSFDMKDVSAIAETIEAAAKNTADTLKIKAEERNREMERRLLQPIMEEDLESADFVLSKLIRVTEIDKRRAESEVCAGSVGFVSDQKDLRIVNIFRDKINAFGITLYPDDDDELYYVDPSDRDRYIALDNYFSYLKTERINELQKIAQDLGAKHFRVIYKEQKSSFSKTAVKGKGTAKAVGNSAMIDAESELAATAVSTVEIAAEMHCPGRAPIEPKLCYLQKEPSIQKLIELRMDSASPITHQKFTLQLSNSVGIKERDAVKIDAALKAMKIAGTNTLSNEVQNESRRFFEYEIDF